jgi:hypothetical protein
MLVNHYATVYFRQIGLITLCEIMRKGVRSCNNNHHIFIKRAVFKYSSARDFIRFKISAILCTFFIMTALSCTSELTNISRGLQILAGNTSSWVYKKSLTVFNYFDASFCMYGQNFPYRNSLAVGRNIQFCEII